ncbi:MAG: hypothetical protein PHX18_04130 [Candidatus Gastranaerophilales bacterium]|nr:hypothetical protein [Candidatus Gastranaerophilales bacterium]
MLKRVILVATLALSINTIVLSQSTTPTPKPQQTAQTCEVRQSDLVLKPKNYLSKKIKINASFDKFSTLGLDYEPVNMSSKDYISFLIKRNDVKEYDIPLSELKLIIKRDYAEKELINIENNDKIEVYGKVFSTALGDPWVLVDKVVILTPKENKKAESK